MDQIINFFSVASFAVGNIYKLPFANIGTGVSLLDATVLLTLIYTVIKDPHHAISQIKRYAPYTKSVVVFASVALLSLLVSGGQYGVSAQLVGLNYILRWLAYAVVGLVLPKNISILGMGLSVVVIGIIQYLFLPDVRFLAQQQWDPHYYRIIGSFLDPGFTGLVIVLFLGWVTTNKIKYQKLIWIISYVALALTYSRSSYIAFVVLIAIIAMQKKSFIFFAKIFSVGVITLFLLPRPGGEGAKLERTSTIYARLVNWNQTLTIASDHPVLGVGFNVYRYAQRQYGFLTDSNWDQTHAGAGADSSLLFVLATTGIAGIAVYCLYLYSISKIPGTALYILPIIVHSWFLNSLFYPAVLFFLAVLISKSKAGKQP